MFALQISYFIISIIFLIITIILTCLSDVSQEQCYCSFYTQSPSFGAQLLSGHINWGVVGYFYKANKYGNSHVYYFNIRPFSWVGVTRL